MSTCDCFASSYAEARARFLTAADAAGARLSAHPLHGRLGPDGEPLGIDVALLAGEGNGLLRASVRAPRGFAVDAALNACSELL